MIKDKTPLSLCEVKKLLGDVEESPKSLEMAGFIKKFCKTKPEKAEEIKKKLEDLGILKLKPEHIVKIIDLLPEDAEDLNKIFTDVSLDADETTKILESVK